jgi:transposase-like protein
LCFWPFRNKNPYNGKGKADEHMVKKDDERTIPKDVLRAFIKENNLKTAEDVQHALRDIFSGTLQEMLEAVMDQNLSYEKHDDNNKHTENRRNGHSKKTVRSEYGDITLEVPRDRDGEFEPLIVKKR